MRGRSSGMSSAASMSASTSASVAPRAIAAALPGKWPSAHHGMWLSRRRGAPAGANDLSADAKCARRCHGNSALFKRCAASGWRAVIIINALISRRNRAADLNYRLFAKGFPRKRQWRRRNLNARAPKQWRAWHARHFSAVLHIIS